MRIWRLRALALIFLSLGFTISACGGDSTTASSGKTYPAPFDTGKGEGNLLSSSAVTTYSTGATAAMEPSPEANPAAVPDLDAYYVQTICPDSLSEKDCAQNETSLNTADFGNFDVTAHPIANNSLGIQQVDAVKITYGAINVGGAAVNVSGGIVIPELAAASIKGIVLYFHGTTVQRSNVPSNFITADNPNGNYQGILLSALWASQGYVVVMPDFIGLGDDTADPHPYVVYPEENAQSGLAMLKAARTYLLSTDRVQGHVPLFITGYSEGGAYALVAAHMMQTNPRYASALKASLEDAVTLSGVFDLTGTMLPYLFYNISNANNPWFSLSPSVSALSKPYLSANLALGFAHYQNIAPSDIIVDAFYTCTMSNQPNCGTSGNLDGLYYEANISDPTAVLAVAVQAGQTDWSTASNSVVPLLTTAYAQALMQGDTSNPLYALLLKANTYQFIPQFPLALVSLQQDSVVTRVNTDVAFSYISGQNPTGPYLKFLLENRDFAVPGLFTGAPVDHTTELPFLAVLALNQFNLNP